jgi:hypothetical protein
MAKSEATPQASGGPESAAGTPAASSLQDEEPEQKTTTPETVAEVMPRPVEPTELILSGGLKPAQSWFSANKYVVVAMLVIGAGVAAFLLLR